MVLRRRVFEFTALSLLSFSACQSLSKANRARGEGYALLEKKDYTGAESAFEKATALATEPEEKTKSLLGAGQAYLKAGDAATALRLFYEARRTHNLGALASETNRAIGEAYFAIGNYALARRYLSKGLEDLKKEERDLTLSMLVICCRDLDDVAAATQYRSQLSQPLSEEVEKILSSCPRRLPQQALGAAELEEGSEMAQEPSWIPPPEREPPVTQPRAPEEGKLLVISREGWNARPPRRNIEPMGQVDKITIHHTGGDLYMGSTRADAAEEIRRIQKYHQMEQGWADIGYHYVIDRVGNIWQARRLCYQGAHARGTANYGNVGVVLLGNYCQQGITSRQREGLELLVEKLCEHFNIPPERVYTHQEIANGKTDCPGPALARCVRQMREHLRRRLVAYRP